ncbi:integrin alpha-9-like [Mercenaria mercenaria]|uniref:integrin alpha-9-like n=1 Tax=Mercenaria mercenaria TaxID=6596 RepID=UPI00234F3019|nr:integrin alpha-9-like [Mercenaria mercenaria]
MHGGIEKLFSKSDMLEEMSVREFCDVCDKMKSRKEASNSDKDDPVTINSTQMCSNLSSGLFAFRYHMSLILTVLLYMTSIPLTNGFNLDITSKIEFEGPNRGSYYGYTVAMMNQNDQNSWILFGAPKDSSVYLPDVEKPGAIYKCTFTRDFSARTCEEVFIDDITGSGSAPFDGKSRSFTHGRDDQWLGASLDVQEGKGIVTCASRWYNKQFLSSGYYFMNGLCYEIPLDFNRNNIKTIPGLVAGDKQTMTIPGTNVTKLNYGMGNLGASVHYTSQGEDLLLGAPGLWYFTGGFIDLHQTEAYFTDYNKTPTEINEMAGYAITSGQYFGGELTMFAIGAPRDHLTGKVFLYGSNRKTFVLDDPDLTLNGSEITEIPVNGFFGAALCTVDVNKDGLDDLLVAAPFYSKGEREETGMVIVYLGQDDMTFKPMSTMLTGSDKSGARFGTAIASLGDLNKDKYNDIVVGAPYEDDLQGAIYVYNGCKTGIWPHFSQRIAAASLRTGLMSFGISFSKAEDMDSDGVNDIAVGAYLSDKAYLLFGQSVINIEITLQSSVTQIDKDTTQMCPSTDGSDVVPCFRVGVCFFYLYRQFSTIEVNVTLQLDTYMGEYNRIAFRSNGQGVEHFPLKLFSGDRTCISDKDVLIKSTSDLVTPVRMKASYEVLDIPSGSARVQPTINKFNGENPDKHILIATKIVDFKKDCPNNECKTDLHLTAEAKYGTSTEYFIIGSSTLTIDVSILKSGDPSYSSNFFITVPNTLQYQKVTKVYGDPEINCGFVNLGDEESGEEDMDSLDYLQRKNIPKVLEDEFLMACSFGNPMYKNTGVRFQLSMVVPDSINNTKLEFRLNATTLSTELEPKDNMKSLSVEVRNQVKTTFTGISKPISITIRDEAQKYITSHIYELRNKGPSPLPYSTLMILYPQIQQGGKPHLYLNTTSWSCTPPCRIQCAFPDNPNSAPVVHASNAGPTYVIDETLPEENIGESRTVADMKNIDCSKGGCSRYECKLYDIPPRESAVVTLEYVATGDILSAIVDGDAMKIRSEGHVRLKDLSRLIADTTEHSTSVYSDLLPVTPPPKRLPWWIILVSVLAGLLLIFLVIFILWKIGFFKRKKMEEIRRMQHEGQIEKEKMLPDDEEANGNKG